MKFAASLAVILLLPVLVAAQPVTGRAQASYENYDFGRVVESGMRTSFDLGLDRAFTGNSRLRFFLRGYDFRGETEIPQRHLIRESRSREYQPSGELSIDAETLRLFLRADYIDYTGSSDFFDTNRTTERALANLQWDPIGLPSFAVTAQRSVMHDAGRDSEPVEESASASVQYPWRGLTTAVDVRYARSADPFAGYDRTMSTYGGSVGYALSLANGRFTLGADANGTRSEIDERATGGESVRVPVQVTFNRALFSIDDTPSDNRDHPLASYPALRDGDLNASANIPLGPDGVSFINLGVDLGRSERIDEVRVTVRDANGNPLRTGGGPVTFDAWISEDGVVWRPVSEVETNFDATRSAYVVTFPILTTRWIKVVSFGVNSERSFITELQAFYHVVVDPGSARNGQQQSYGAMLSASFRPTKNVKLGYGASYTSIEQDYATRASTSNSRIDHSLTLEYNFARNWVLRGEASRGESMLYGLTIDRGDSILAALDWRPTRRLQVSAETNRQSQTVDGTPTLLILYGFRATGQPLRTVTLSLDAGMQSQKIENSVDLGRRTYANLTASARVTKTVRMLLSGSLQRASSSSDDPATLLLGAARADRLWSELAWNPGRALIVSARVGYISSAAVSGFTQRVRVEWSPFEGGTVALIGTYDEDIDPMSDRRARRMVFSPRWTMNRFVTFDFNYTAVSTQLEALSEEQKTLFFSVTVTK